MEKFLEKTEKAILDTGVANCGLSANKTNDMFYRYTEHPENKCGYMSLVALETFVAELCFDYIINRHRYNFNDNLTRTIENAIWKLDADTDDIDWVIVITNILFDQYKHTMSDIDILLLRVIAYSDVRRSMDYYINVAETLAKSYSWEIRLEKILSNRIHELEKIDYNGVSNAVDIGKSAFSVINLKTANPYSEDEIGEAWHLGYELQRIERIWKKAVNGTESH